MKRLAQALILTLAACSPAIEAHDENNAMEPATLEAPAMPALVRACPADELATEDGIGGTGCR